MKKRFSHHLRVVLSIPMLIIGLSLVTGAGFGKDNTIEFGSRRAANVLLTGGLPQRWIELAGGERAPKYLKWPMPGRRIGRGFGTRDGKHQAVDITAPVGTPVRAMAPGIVAYANNELKGYGNVMMLVHSGGWVTLYAHLDRFNVKPGRWVSRGDVIARSGNTGVSQGPHLHFALIVNGQPTDPMPIMRGVPAQQVAGGPLQF